MVLDEMKGNAGMLSIPSWSDFKLVALALGMVIFSPFNPIMV